MSAGQRATKPVERGAADTSIDTHWRQPVNRSEPPSATAIEAAAALPARVPGFELFVVDTRGAQHRLRVTGVSAPPEPAAAPEAPARAVPSGEPAAPAGAPEIRRIAVAMGSVDGTDAAASDTDK